MVFDISDPLTMTPAIVPITATDGNDFAILGTGFVIHRFSKRAALMMTASHVLLEMAKYEDTFSAASRTHLPGVSALPSKSVVFQRMRALVSVYLGPQKMFVANVVISSFQDSHDVALAVIEIPEPIDVPDECFSVTLALNSAAPAIGTELVALDYSQSDAVATGERSWKQRLIVHTRHGRVLEVKSRGASLVRAPGFLVDMPFHSGMSGGPLLDISDPSRPFVRGLVSSDLSIDDGGRGTGVAAFASSTLSAYKLETGVTTPVPGGGQYPIKLENLVQAGFVVDIGYPGLMHAMSVQAASVAHATQTKGAPLTSKERAAVISGKSWDGTTDDPEA